MREIKFRGKDINGNWVYGDLLHSEHLPNEILIGGVKRDENGKLFQSGILIDKETIGQYTGLKDKNGKEIYEGDIVKIVNNYSEATKRTSDEVIVEFKDGSFIVTWDVDGDEHYNHFTSYNTPVVTFEVIGNIHS